jgi:peptidoglycan hydrolase CwlO-like protein
LTVEIALVISVVSVLASLIFGFATYKRNNNNDVSESAFKSAKTAVMIENIATDVRDIKAEQKSFTNDIRALNEKVITVEQSCKSAHHRIDRLEGVSGNEREISKVN